MGKITICLASNDVASVFKDFRRIFESNGFNVITYVSNKPASKIIEQDLYNYWGPKYFPKIFKQETFCRKVRPINSIYVRLRTIFEKFTIDYQFKKILKKSDIFIFFHDTFYSDQRDLEILKKAGKKVIMVFVGDDARWYHGMKQDFQKNGLDVYTYGDGYDYSSVGLEVRLQKIRKAEKFADFVFSKREQSQLQIRPFYHYPMVIHMDDYEFVPFQRNKRPVIVHAPSNREIKGTKYLIDVVAKLEDEGIPFDFRLVENMSHKEAKNVYKEADIIVDQLFIPGAGKLASEALAMGKVVLGRMEYGNYEQGFPISTCPIVDSNPLNIYQNLKTVILDYNLRIKLAAQGRLYAQNFLGIHHLADKIEKLINGESIEFDYHPSFFLQEYEPESEEAGMVIQKWLDFVREEEWYKDIIKQSELSNNFNF